MSSILLRTLGYSTRSSNRICDSADLDLPVLTVSPPKSGLLPAILCNFYSKRLGILSWGGGLHVSLVSDPWTYLSWEELEFHFIPEPSCLAEAGYMAVWAQAAWWGSRPHWILLCGQGRGMWLSLWRVEKGSKEYVLANCWIVHCVLFLLAFFCFHASPSCPPPLTPRTPSTCVCWVDTSQPETGGSRKRGSGKFCLWRGSIQEGHSWTLSSCGKGPLCFPKGKSSWARFSLGSLLPFGLSDNKKLFPGGFLLMALVQMVPDMVHHVRLLFRHGFTLIVWLSPQSPKPGTKRLPRLPLLSFCSCCSPSSGGLTPTAVFKLSLLLGPGPRIDHACRTSCLGSWLVFYLSTLFLKSLPCLFPFCFSKVKLVCFFLPNLLKLLPGSPWVSGWSSNFLTCYLGSYHWHSSPCGPWQPL